MRGSTNAQTNHEGLYLPLSGGTVHNTSSTTPLTLKSGNPYYSFIGFTRSTGGTVYLGSFNGKPVFNDGSNHELAYKSDLESIQDQLTIDTVPTSGSNNLITSGAVYQALESAGGYTAGNGIDITNNVISVKAPTEIIIDSISVDATGSGASNHNTAAPITRTTTQKSSTVGGKLIKTQVYNYSTTSVEVDFYRYTSSTYTSKLVDPLTNAGLNSLADGTYLLTGVAASSTNMYSTYNSCDVKVSFTVSNGVITINSATTIHTNTPNGFKIVGINIS